MKMIALLASTAALLLSGCDKAPTGNDAAAAPAANLAAATPAGTDWTSQVVATPEGGFRMGNPDAPVKLVEFASMTCSHCRDFSAASTPALQDKYVKTGKVSYEFRNFVRDQIDVVASLLARCGGPGPFFKLTEQMFAEQDQIVQRLQANAAELQAAEAKPGAQTFVRVAEIAGLDKFVGMRGIPEAKAKACLLNEGELNKLVAMNQTAARDYKIPGTPTFLINGKMVDDATEWKTLEPKIKSALGA